MPESKTRGCTIDGCDRPHKGHGYCELHRSRWKRGTPLDAPVGTKTKDPYEKRARTSNGSVQVAITLQPDMVAELQEIAGTKYGAQSALIRQAVIHFLSNRDTAYWKKKYNEERAARLALQQKIAVARTALSTEGAR